MTTSGSLVALTCWALVHALWQGAVVAAAVALALSALPSRSARTRYAVCLAGLGLVAAAPIANALWMAAVAANDPQLPFGGDGQMNVSVLRSHAALSRLAPWTLSAWAVGAAVGLSRLAAGQIALRRLVARGTAPPAEWSAACDRLSARLGRAVRVRVVVSHDVQSPILVGRLAPTIVFPLCMTRELSLDQVELLLAHEFGHVRRGDVAANAVQAILEAVLFYHPAVRILSRWARHEREACCDDLVTALPADPAGYARTLLRVADAGRTPGRRRETLRVSAAGGSLLRRVERLVAPADPPRMGPRAWPVVVGFAAALVVGSGVALQPAAHAALEGPFTDVSARDPAGAFRVSLLGERVVAAAIDGVDVSPRQLVQHGDRLWVIGESGRRILDVRVVSKGIRWDARAPTARPTAS